MTIAELYVEAEKIGADVEMYETDATTMAQYLHTDSCRYVGGLGISDNEPTDETHEVVDWTIMDADEYNHTLFANVSETDDRTATVVAIIAPISEE
jgi:hypothetical protein